MPLAGRWDEVLNTDAGVYGGAGIGNLGQARTRPEAAHGHAQSLLLTLPPLSTLYFLRQGE